MAEDERHQGSDGGFDDWLEEEPGPDTDPYAALADEDDAEAEIAEWMAFTEGPSAAGEVPAGNGPLDVEPSDGASDDAPLEEQPTVETPLEEQPTVETPLEDAPAADVEAPDGDQGDDHGDSEDAIDVPVTDDLDAIATFPAIAVDRDPEGGDADTDDEATAEIPVVDATTSEEAAAERVPATSVEVDEFDGGGRADTDEIPIVAGADVLSASVVSTPDDDVDGSEAGRTDGSDEKTTTGDHITTDVEATTGVEADADEETDDTGELDTVDTGELGVPDEDADDASAHDTDDDLDFSQEHYLQTSTRDHAGLAAAIAEADSEDTEQVALAAPIPGLESTVVGFDDVVEAEGHARQRARGGGDLVARVITAIVLIAALGASLVWRPALVALATVVFVIGAGEFYTALARSGRHPIALFGFLGILGASLGAFVWGAIAIPVSFVIVATVMLMYYAVVPGRSEPMGNLALTVTVMAWVGMGTYAMPIAVSDDYRTLVIGVVVIVATMDIAQYFVGRSIGRHQLAPQVSPKKTIEGLVAGVIVAFALGALLHFFPPFELTSGLAIGAAVAVLSPLGDLAMSAAKRALDIKDMGSILPGHGGFLDRIDGLLFVIPAAWAIFLWTGLI